MSNPMPYQGPKPVAHGRKAMVSSSHPAVTKVMIDVLRDGGNAVDATVAGSLVQPVYEPHMTNHAGTVALLYWDASEEKAYFMDACAELPDGLPPLLPKPIRGDERLLHTRLHAGASRYAETVQLQTLALPSRARL